MEYILKIYQHDRKRFISFGRNYAHIMRRYAHWLFNLDSGECIEVVRKSATGQEEIMKEYTQP